MSDEEEITSKLAPSSKQILGIKLEDMIYDETMSFFTFSFYFEFRLYVLLGALLLKNNFEIVQKNQLIVYGDKLFAKNKSIEDLLITDFSHLFNETNVINFSFPPLPSYSTNMESLGNYFKKWAGTYLTLLVILAEENEQDKKIPSSYKALHGLVKKKVKSILRIMNNDIG
ncbi:7002_t:CDS:2 [Racocetra persica]|uniref:7002_t:CDS:1 n=1 Tax=Racocetra persica TaxID=160502 RepID=A0ACA9MWU2_9GLOM|nr:7002_t:CDS:2 [Racocetra persica]